MSVLLPSSPGVQSAKPKLLDFGATLTPPMGGPAQRLNRIGNRFSIDVTLPSTEAIGRGRVFVSRLAQALTAGALFAFPQDFQNQATGAPIVNGAGQTGSSLQLHGFTAGVPIFEGQFFSIIYAGRRYLHGVAADAVADGNGAALVSLFPMLRISPNDGAICEFAQPMIEGFLSGSALEWQLQTAPYTDINFTIAEAA